MDKPIIVWLRKDLRLRDNPALDHAVRTGRPVIPLFIREPNLAWDYGAASKLWLHASLSDFDASLNKRGGRLILREGEAAEVLQALLAETGADLVIWNRRYEPSGLEADRDCERRLAERCELKQFSAHLLVEPSTIKTLSGNPYRVFTPFYRNCLKTLDVAAPLPPPARLLGPTSWPASVPLEELRLRPEHRWTAGVSKHWTIGEGAAWRRLEQFIEDDLLFYSEARDYPAKTQLSKLSPHLAFGEISARTIYHALSLTPPTAALDGAGEVWLRQLFWREFAYHVLYHFPSTTDSPFRPAFAEFPWLDDDDGLSAWQRGETGYPLVDAGMRELWATGYMHNRVRMIAASFLCKHLGVHWLHGARWFWDTLVDADLANNSLGWQWVAGCGADAAPYFRIFNPLTQGQKFDPQGHYIRRWVSELSDPAMSDVHSAGANGYLEPIIEHRYARSAALARLELLRQ